MGSFGLFLRRQFLYFGLKLFQGVGLGLIFELGAATLCETLILPLRERGCLLTTHLASVWQDGPFV